MRRKSGAGTAQQGVGSVGLASNQVVQAGVQANLVVCVKVSNLLTSPTARKWLRACGACKKPAPARARYRVTWLERVIE